MRTLLMLLAAWVAAIFVATPANAEEQNPRVPAVQKPAAWGTVLGRIVYDGAPPKPVMVTTHGKLGPNGPKEVLNESLLVGKNGGLANVFVYLRSKPSQIHPGYAQSKPEKIKLRVKDYRYIPHAFALWTHDLLDFQNEEVYGVSLGNSSPVQGTSILLAPGGNVERQFQIGEYLPMTLSCNIHPWMSAKLLVRDNPYFCVTDERGIFCIPNLPTNEDTEFTFWHERVGYLKNIKSDVAAFTTNDKGRLQTKLTGPVTDLGEFRIDPKLFEVSR